LAFAGQVKFVPKWPQRETLIAFHRPIRLIYMRHVVLRRFSIHKSVSLGACLTVFISSGNGVFAQTATLPAPAASTAPAPSSGAGAAAPKPAAASTNAAARNAVLGAFPLAPGDVIAVNVANHPELSGNLPVTEAGKITLPTLGNLTVAGKTIAQAEKAITAAISTELMNPAITVTITSAVPRQVLMVGSVRNGGGPIELRPNSRVSDAIDMAGGLSAEPDDLIATLSRGKAQPQRLSLTTIMQAPRSAANVTLKPGDILRFNLVPGRTVTVAGDVKQPTNVTLRRSVRLLDALVGAGGLIQKPETTKITVIRGGREMLINTAQAFSQIDSAANVPLLNGDLVMVEAIRTNISVVALNDEVRNSGNISIEGTPRVLQAVLAADMTAPAADLDVSIRRGVQRIPVDLAKAAYDPTFDLPLRDGDVLLFAPRAGPMVRVAGGVSKPGELNLAKDATLLDAIFASGGLNGKPEEVKLTILRQNAGRQSVLNVDPVSLISLRDLGQNVRLNEGDLVMVNPVESRTVFIAGQVTEPGAFAVGENDGLAELMLRAGGPTPFAALKQVQVLRRDNTTLTVDVSKASEAGAGRIPIKLEPGDLVTVPRNPNRVLVMNAVQRPGYVPYPESGTLTIGDAILMAGGTVGGARLNMVALIRRSATGEIDRKIVPLNDVAKGKDAGQLGIETVLQPGDIVYVPEGRTTAPAFQRALGTVTNLAVLRNLFGP
jgi:protein involved in polysaccharide export with SLBB domain